MTQKVCIPLPLAESMIEEIESEIPFSLTIAGSVRRRKEVVGDIDFVVASGPFVSSHIKDVLDKILVAGEQKIRGIYKGVQVDFVLAEPKSWGATLLHCTGSKKTNILQRIKARKMRMILNERGLYRIHSDHLEWVAGETEEQIYNYLAIPFLNPEERE